jgi:hypothetical protein
MTWLSLYVGSRCEGADAFLGRVYVHRSDLEGGLAQAYPGSRLQFNMVPGRDTATLRAVKVGPCRRKAVLRFCDVYPRSECFPSRIRIRIKEFKYRYFNPKNCFLTLGNLIRDVHPGSGSWFFLPLPDPGVEKALDLGSGSVTLQKRMV